MTKKNKEKDSPMCVEVSNRTRAGVAINFAQPVKVTVAGENIESDSVIIPRTAKGEYASTPVVFAASDWKNAAKMRAVQGLVETGQLEVR